MITAIIPVYHNEDILDKNFYYLNELGGKISQFVFVFDGYNPGEEFYWKHDEEYIIKVCNYPDIPWGNARARNIGAINASNDYLLFLDVDHTFKTPFTLKPEPNKVYKFKRVLEKNRVALQFNADAQGYIF